MLRNTEKCNEKYIWIGNVISQFLDKYLIDIIWCWKEIKIRENMSTVRANQSG